MAQIPYRANLSATVFPMTISRGGRTVINPGIDQNYDKRIDPTNSTTTVGIPQILYCENVFPTSEGFQSIGVSETGVLSAGGINTVETIRLAVSVEENSVTPDIDILDEGNVLSEWITSPNDTSGLDFREVTQDAAEGDPLPSYRVVYDRNEHIPAYFYKNFGLSATDNFKLTFDFKLGGSIDVRGDAFMKYLSSSTGTSLYVQVAHRPADVADSIILGQGTGWSVEFGNTPLVTNSLSARLNDTDWYTVVITAVKNPDETWTLQGNVTNKTTLTELGSVTFSGEYIMGDYLGAVNETSIHSADGTGLRYTTWYDNLHIEAAISDISYLTVAGITNIDVTFYADNTVKYSHGNVDSYENLTVVVPAGFESPAGPENFSTTSVRGECFVCIIRVDGTTHIYRVTFDTVTSNLVFTEVTATIKTSLGLAFNMDNIVAIAGSYNYLILLTPDSVLWSSTTTPTDFAPSLVSGAGSERIGNLKGDINFAREHVLGLILYTNGNAVSMLYTGNVRYPWKFREIDSSAGYTYSQQVAGDTNSNTQFGLSNAKTVQAINTTAAEIIAPEASNFFERTTRWDSFNYSTNVFNILSTGGEYDFLSVDGKYRVWYVLDRYVLIAYEHSTVTYGLYHNLLVFDFVLSRFGKIRRAFHTVLSNEYGMYLVNYNTHLKLKILFDTYDLDAIHEGVILLGKFAVTRDRFITLDEVSFESRNTDGVPADIAVLIYPTLNGNKFETPVVPVLDNVRSDEMMKSYKCRVSGQNFSILAKGAFDLNTIDMRVHQDGTR